MISFQNKTIKLIALLFIFQIINGCTPKVNTVVTGSGKTDTTDIIEGRYININSDTVDYFREDYIRYYDFVYADNIHTVQLYREGWEFAAPVQTLNSDEKLVLTFDDLDGGIKNYKYTLIHCSANWVATDLLPQQYLNGLTENFITDYTFSFNTIQNYTHYKLILPDDNSVTPTLSGNYILKVFIDDEDKTPILTRRLMIFENNINATAIAKRATDIVYKNYKQEIDITLNTSGYYIDNPYMSLNVTILQNGRWDNARYNLKPKYIKGDIFDYDYEDVNVFSGGNEFRNFDIKSLKWNSPNVQNIYYDSAGYQIELKQDEKVSFKTYYSVKDINGKYLIRSEDNIRNHDIESEYVWVHFFLNYPAVLTNGDLYVFGELSDWGFSMKNKMKYNYQKKGYESTMYLKQGYYNYQYVFLENGEKVGDEALIEGMHFETENDYTILVYYRDRKEIYDRLIALKQINTYSGN